jgi:hypothetical protein
MHIKPVRGKDPVNRGTEWRNDQNPINCSFAGTIKKSKCIYQKVKILMAGNKRLKQSFEIAKSGLAYDENYVS